MASGKDQPTIREDDVEARGIQRRTFLGRFGAAAGLAGMVGFTAGCGSSDSDIGDTTDSDIGDTADQDSSDAVDADSGDPVQDPTDRGDPA